MTKQFDSKGKSRTAFKIYVSVCVHLWMILLCFSANAQTLAPGAPGKDAQWASAGKQGVGTAANTESKVWFTLAQGALTEVYYPDVTAANVHKLEFVVVNQKTKRVETETEDANHKIEVVKISRTKNASPISNIGIYKNYFSPSSLSFIQTNRSKTGDWSITKTYVTDPKNNSVMISVKFHTESPDNQLYIYYDASLGNSGMGDSAWSQENAFLSLEKDKASALTCRSCKFGEMTNGFLGTSDGLEQLKKDGKIVNPYGRAEDGNVVQTAKLTPTFSKLSNTDDFVFEISLGFGKTSDEALTAAQNSLLKGFAKTSQEYQEGWIEYLKTIPQVDEKYQAQFNMAAMQLKAHEDKTVRGANIASLTVPWGGGANANENNIGGYHLIWSRDLYQVATAYMAMGDDAAALRALDFLFKVQQKPDGSFPQNSFLDGKPFWGSLQLDEVAFPLILAYQLGRNDKATYENHVKPAADFIVKNGPRTTQERWEEEGGFSPSTIAAEIAGLVCAAEIARKNGDEASETIYLATADDWAQNVERWTATTTGKYVDGNYYLRITQNGAPDKGERIELNNGAGFFDEREIVDAGFLELVRLGIKSPDDSLIAKSVKVIDRIIRVSTPNGDAFYRYNHDGYGEMDDGRRWNWDGKYTGKGRLWALLSGERGQYELAKSIYAVSKLKSPVRGSELKSPVYDGVAAYKRLDAMLGFAGDGLMIPEQIWDKAATPKNTDKQFVPELKFGEGTGSATPLAWSMAQFIRLAVNLKAGRNLDTPDVVYNRYVLGKKPAAGSRQKVENRSDYPATVDISEIPASFSNGIDTRCWNQKPLFKKDCSYVSTTTPEISENPILRPCRVGGFFIACKDSAKEMHACFGYQGKFKTLEIAGDFTDWKPVALGVEKKPSGYFSPCFNFAKTARVEYKLIVDGKWITDPLNPNKIDNGGGGENSFFTMPDYKPTVWADGSEMTKSGIETIQVDSKIYGARDVKVYVPEAFSNQALPVLYLQDGSDYINRAGAITIQRNLVKAAKLKPFIMVFLDPKDRLKEYWASDDYAKFLATEIVPAIDAKYNTIKNRDGRAVLGASLGGITSFWVGLKYPETFSRIGGQSSSFWIDNERVVKELSKLDAGKTKFHFYLDDGAFEGVDDSRRVNVLLRGRNFPVVYREGETGHNWTSWRDRLADAFIALRQN